MAAQHPSEQLIKLLREVIGDWGKTLRAALLLSVVCATVLIVTNSVLIGGAIGLAVVTLITAGVRQVIKSRNAAVEPRAAEPIDHQIGAAASGDRQRDGYQVATNIDPMSITGSPHVPEEVKEAGEKHTHDKAVGREPEQAPRLPRQSR
jgi:hypothetical protein